jgi:hypothetical protein
MSYLKKFVLITLSFCFLMNCLISDSRVYATTPAVEKDTFFVTMRAGEDKKISFPFTNISKKQSAIFVQFLSKQFAKGDQEKWSARLCMISLLPTQNGQATEAVRAGESVLIDLCINAKEDVGLNKIAKIVLELNPIVDPKLKTTVTFYLICLAPKEIHLTIGQDGVTIKEGRALVPLRLIGENFEADIGWDTKTKRISFTLSVCELDFWIGKKEMQIKIGSGYARMIPIEVSPLLVSNRTFVPLRIITENLGTEVQYDPITRKITIHCPALPKRN